MKSYPVTLRLLDVFCFGHDVDFSISRLRLICYDKDVDYRLMKKLSGDFPFTWRLLLWTWRWLLGYLPMGRLLNVILILSSRWLMVDVEFILKRRWLLGNNGDFPFTWRSFNNELTLTLDDVDFILKKRWLSVTCRYPVTVRWLDVFCFGPDVDFSVIRWWAVDLTSIWYWDHVDLWLTLNSY